MRVSYSGYYAAFPRLKGEFDSLYPHQPRPFCCILSIRRIIMFKKAELLAIAKDRVAIILLVVLAVETIIIIASTIFRLHASDVQVPVRYTGYGTANIYRGQWYTLWSFSIFAIIVTAINGFLAIKTYHISKFIGRGIMGFSAFILVTELFVLSAIFNLAPSI